MSEIDQDTGFCPLGISDCDWEQQLSVLKREVVQLQSQASSDPLTGLFNYRYFETILQNEMQRSNRTGLSTILIMVDLDFFKKVNDEWGHEGGNRALQLTASIFRQELRAFDISCRYGGEEFALILPQTALPMAVRVAERVRLAIQNTPVDFADKQFRITASMGVGVYQIHDNLSFEGFVDSADQYLYQAKQNGRNQVCFPDFASIKAPTAVSSEEKAALFSSS